MKNLKNQAKNEVKQVNETSKKKLSLNDFKISVGDISKIVGGTTSTPAASFGQRQDCGH